MSDHQVQTTQHHRRQLFPQTPPLRCTCQLMSLTSSVLQQRLLFKRIPFVWRCLFRPNREGYIMPCFGSFHRKCLPCFQVLFVLYSTCLTVRIKRIVELMNVLCCYYLLACACMDLLFLCSGGGTERNPGLKKKKIRSIQYTM